MICVCRSRLLYNDIDKNNDELKKNSVIILGLPHFAVILCQNSPHFRDGGRSKNLEGQVVIWRA